MRSARPKTRADSPPVSLRIGVQNPSRSRRVPAAGRVVRWVRHALGDIAGRIAVRQAEITVRFVSRPEAAALNKQFRALGYAPNVLSFPYDGAAVARNAVNGDIAICPAIVATEARTQGKAFEAHLAHLVVHGVLHLRGYDHIEARDAVRMERLESKLVMSLGHPDPWAGEAPDMRQ